MRTVHSITCNSPCGRSFRRAWNNRKYSSRENRDAILVPGGCSFCLPLFFNAVALHRIEATGREMQRRVWIPRGVEFLWGCILWINLSFTYLTHTCIHVCHYRFLQYADVESKRIDKIVRDQLHRKQIIYSAVNDLYTIISQGRSISEAPLVSMLSIFLFFQCYQYFFILERRLYSNSSVIHCTYKARDIFRLAENTVNAIKP